MLLNHEDAKAIDEMHRDVAPQILEMNMLVPARLPLQRGP